jgi:hypothetical protein
LAVREALIWVAGVFDAKGWCRVMSYSAVKNGKRYSRAVAHVTVKSRSAVETIRSIVGFGSIQLMKSRGPRNGFTHTNERWRYQALNSSAVRFLLYIKPFLRIKKIVVDKLLSGRVQGRCE